MNSRPLTLGDNAYRIIGKYLNDANDNNSFIFRRAVRLLLWNR